MQSGAADVVVRPDKEPQMPVVSEPESSAAAESPCSLFSQLRGERRVKVGFQLLLRRPRGGAVDGSGRLQRDRLRLKPSPTFFPWLLPVLELWETHPAQHLWPQNVISLCIQPLIQKGGREFPGAETQHTLKSS